MHSNLALKPRRDPDSDPDVQDLSSTSYFAGAVHLLSKDPLAVSYGFSDTLRFQSPNSTKLVTFFTDPELRTPLCAPWFDVEVVTDRAAVDPVVGPGEGMCVGQQNGIRWYQERTGRTRVLVRFAVPRACCRKVASRLYYCVVEEPPDELDDGFLWAV